jgi:uncharacterized membrane protein
MNRIRSIDVVRGVVMVLMAIDHVRVYAGVPAGGHDPAVFFTRWITHFVAPAFAFLAGTSAYLYGRKLAGVSALSRFLVSRGIWLVFLELTILRIAWTFNFDFAHYMLAGVIWMLGWCMVLLAALVWLPTRVIAAFGLFVIFAHNLIGNVLPENPMTQILYFGGPIGEGPLFILYSIVPWIGVMAAGYAFGAVLMLDPRRRDRICAIIGTSAIALFVLLRFTNVYGDPRPWKAPNALLFLNTTKYPASLQFLLMTLGPMLVLMPLAERARGRVAEIFATFGRVPFFYYLLHIPLIHVMAITVSLVREGKIDPWLFANHPAMPPPPPPGYMWSLPLLYLVFAIVVAMLYLPCRWYAAVKARHRDSLLRYV